MNIEKTKDHFYLQGNQNKFTAPIPIICPHCSTMVYPTVLATVGTHAHSSGTFFTSCLINQCCNQPFLVNHLVKNQRGDLLSIWPSYNKFELPESLKILSPRFVELYNQSYFAEQENFFELAGSGYRNALEVLIKDFAIKELNKPEADVVKLNLNRAISTYMPTINLSASADVVRILGNDYTHYERHYDHLEFSILKRYLKIFIDTIENEYLINHPVTSLPIPEREN